MPSQEFTDARALLDELESHWISLLLWLSQQSGVSPETLVDSLGVPGIDPISDYKRRRARVPGGTFTPLHFLQFPHYVDVAAKHGTQLSALGNPPFDWIARLRKQRDELTPFRNDLQHAARFDLLTGANKKAAAGLFAEQLRDLAAWWPDHPYRAQEPIERDPARAALEMLGHDETSAVALAERLGFAKIKNPANLTGASETTQLTEALRADIPRLYRVGQKSVKGGTAGLFLAFLKEWPPRSAARERFRRRLAKALVESNLNSRYLIVMADDRDDHIDPENREIEIVYPRARANRPLGTVRAVVNLSRPTRHHLDLLRELDISHAASLTEIIRRWNDAFNVERVTNAFYKEFHGLRNSLAEALVVHNPDHPALEGRSLADLNEAKPDPGRRAFQLNVNAFATLSSAACSFSGSSSKRAGSAATMCPARGPSFSISSTTAPRNATPTTPSAWFRSFSMLSVCRSTTRATWSSRRRSASAATSPILTAVSSGRIQTRLKASSSDSMNPAGGARGRWSCRTLSSIPSWTIPTPWPGGAANPASAPSSVSCAAIASPRRNRRPTTRASIQIRSCSARSSKISTRRPTATRPAPITRPARSCATCAGKRWTAIFAPVPTSARRCSTRFEARRSIGKRPS